MKALLDSHTLLWWFADSPQLSVPAAELIDDPMSTIFVSAATAWEICTKVRIGKLPTGKFLCEDFAGIISRNHFTALPVQVEHAQLAGLLPANHKDPFDRMLVAQAMIEQMPLVTNDAAIAEFNVRIIW
jgi:PIN domain nuclease of toxin-antitoxin system